MRHLALQPTILATVILIQLSSCVSGRGTLAFSNVINVRQPASGKLEVAGIGSQWQVAKLDDKVGKYIVRCVKEGAAPWVLLEHSDKTSGEFLYVHTDGTQTRIKKMIGTVGKHSDPPKPVTYSKPFWDKLVAAKDDFMAKELLSKSKDDPSYAQIQSLYPPMLKPESFVGMKGYAHEVYVAANGSVGLDADFYADNQTQSLFKYSDALHFNLNGRPVTERECETTMKRSLLGGYMPATQYVYRQDNSPLGWEQLVVMGKVDGVRGVFVRFRLTNLSDKQNVASFSITEPVGGAIRHGKGGAINIHSKVYVRSKKVTVVVPISTSIPFKIKKDLYSYHNFAQIELDLTGGESEDLFLFLPGKEVKAEKRIMPADKISQAFYTALKTEYNVWADYVKEGMQLTVPELGLEDVFKASMVRTAVIASGDEVPAAGIHYDSFWSFCHTHQIRLELNAGHFSTARRYLVWFIKNRILKDGKLKQRAQSFDEGEFLSAVANYYWYTQDSSVITENKGALDRVVNEIRRFHEVSKKKFPASDPRHGMKLGTMENDMTEKTYFYATDVPIWAGLRDYAQALEDIGSRKNNAEVTVYSKELSSFALGYYKLLRKSFESTAIDRDENGKMVYLHTHPVLKRSGKVHICKYRKNNNEHYYRRFQQHPRFAAYDFLTDEEIRCFYKYEEENESPVLGVRRHTPWIMDDFVAFEDSFQQLRINRPRQYLMKFFNYIQSNAGQGTWSGFEQVNIRPIHGRMTREKGPQGVPVPKCLNGWEGQHATIVMPQMIRNMYVFDEPGGGAIWLASGISRHWLKDGKELKATDVPSRYGILDLTIRYDEKVKSLTYHITPKSDRVIPEIRIRARDPKNEKAKSVSEQNGNDGKLIADQDLVILKNVKGPRKVTVYFNK